MNLYLANGRYVGTQAEARKLDRNFRPVMVPVDKDGLLVYLNTHMVRPDGSGAAERGSTPLPPQPRPDSLPGDLMGRDMSAGAVLARSDNPGIDVDGIVSTIMESKGHALRRFAGAVALAFYKLGGQSA